MYITHNTTNINPIINILNTLVLLHRNSKHSEYIRAIPLVLPSLVRVAKELTSKHNILIPIGKVPSNDRRILTTADDPAGVELEFEDSRVCAVVGVEGCGERVRGVMVMVMVVVWCGVSWACGALCCCCVCSVCVVSCRVVGGCVCICVVGSRTMHCLGCCVEGIGLQGQCLSCLSLSLSLLCESLEVVLLRRSLGVSWLVVVLGTVVRIRVGSMINWPSWAAASSSDSIVL